MLQSLGFIRYKEGALGQPSVPLNLITIAFFFHENLRILRLEEVLD